MVRGHGGHQTPVVYRVWGRGVLWLLAGPSERTQNLRTKPGPKGPKKHFSGTFGLGLVLWFWASPRGLQGANSERSGKLSCRTFRAWLVAGPVMGHRTKGRGPVRKVRQVNLSNISDLVPCKPREGAQNLVTRPIPKGLES